MPSFMESGCDLQAYPFPALGGQSVAGWLLLVVIVPLAVVLTLFLMRVFVAMLFTAKLKRNLGKKICWEDHPQLGPILGELLKRLMVRRKVSIFIFSGHKPLIFNSGWIRPVIFISPLLLEKLDRDEMEVVLAHELAHIGRYDQLILSLVGMLKGLLIIVPYRDLLWKRFTLAREMSCDETAVRVTSKRLILAETLIKIWKMGKDFPFHGWLKGPVPYYTLLEKKSSLEIRVRKLLEGNPPSHGGRKKGLRAGRTFLIAFVMFISAMVFQQVVGTGGEGRSPGYIVDELSLSSCHR